MIYTMPFYIIKCMALWDLFSKLISAFLEESKTKLQMYIEIVKKYDRNANTGLINCPITKGDQSIFFSYSGTRRGRNTSKNHTSC